MLVRRILLPGAAPLSGLAIASAATGAVAVAVASPQAHSLTVRAAHTVRGGTVQPDTRR